MAEQLQTLTGWLAAVTSCRTAVALGTDEGTGCIAAALPAVVLGKGDCCIAPLASWFAVKTSCICLGVSCSIYAAMLLCCLHAVLLAVSINPSAAIIHSYNWPIGSLQVTEAIKHAIRVAFVPVMLMLVMRCPRRCLCGVYCKRSC